MEMEPVIDEDDNEVSDDDGYTGPIYIIDAVVIQRLMLLYQLWV